MTADEATARYLANPRECTDCGGVPDAGRLRCEACHQKLIQDRNEGRTV